MAVKAVAVALIVAAALLLAWPWSLVGSIAIALATVAFFALTVGHPRSQFFVPTVYHLTTRRRVVAFTFDDGPDPVFTPAILDVLAEHRAKATFFVLGSRAAEHPEIIRRIHEEGHTLGTHTQTHSLGFHFAGVATVGLEIQQGIETVASIVPVRPTLFRPPHGVRSPLFARGFAAFRDQRCVTWTVRGFDAQATDAEKIVARVEKRLVPGAIVALHDGTGLLGSHDRSATVQALSVLLERCRERGIRCVGLGELDQEGALQPGAGAFEPERFPLKQVLPGILYWPFRALRTVSVAAVFGAFWTGAAIFAWLALPILLLFGGTPLEKTRRAQRALRRCFQGLHVVLRAMRLFHRRAVEPLPGESPRILVANHPTLADVTAIASLYPNVVCLARSEFAENVFMGRLLRICGFIPTGMNMLEESAERLGQGFDVLVFPEGTRSPLDGGLQPFHRGAFELARRARVPIVLLKLTCRPTALTKALPIWRHPDHMPVLTVTPVGTIEPEAARDSRALCRAVEQRYHELLDLSPEPSLEQTL